MYVLGLNSAYHEPSACLLKNGKLVAAAEEERFNGIRHGKEANPFSSWILPFNSINYCLAKEGITINQIDHIAYSFKPGIRLLRRLPLFPRWIVTLNSGKIEKELGLFFFNSRIPVFLRSYSPKRQEIRKRFLTIGEPNYKFHQIEHHLAHAAGAFLCSRFKEAAILSIDGIGETATTLLAHGRENEISKVEEFQYPDSLGFFYEEITQLLGFQRNHDEFKVMGLAAYGKPKYYNEIQGLVQLKPDGKYKVKIDFEKNSLFSCSELHKVLGPARLWGAPITQRHKDIAASAQKILEETVLHLLDHLYGETESENLCLAGGVALNCLMNQKIREKSKFKNIFIQPAANDAGSALGAALYVYNSLLCNKRNYVMEHAYLGPSFNSPQIEKKLDNSKIIYGKERNIAKKCAELISRGNIVGWFQGRMEWGPRALGNRSILADPRNRRMKDVINSIKGREGFRPLAPAVLEERAGEYFVGIGKSPFMLFTCDVRKEKRGEIPAVVHVDGTTRPQTVAKSQNKRFHELINEFDKLTGVPLLINTSLNYAGKPIACGIEQGLECFYNSGLDYLAIGDYLISKEGEK
ncbi:MAG: carbamoyltransferase C-terminal domain-containing protein [Candidatus Diapherotrites archaeon]